MSITVQGVTKLYGQQRALNNVSFKIKTGEIVGFLGPNGAGKSTMMKIITCYIPPSSGSVQVSGFDTASQSIDVRRNVGYLPEHNMLYLDMFVKEYLHFVGGMYGLKKIKTRVSEIIEMVGLQREQNKQIGALSKGYRQRVGLAQALIHDPQVLVLDEPTSGLDPNQLAEIRMLIKRIGQQKTVMLSTHIMQEVEAVCDRVIIIDKGDIVADENVISLMTSSGQNAYDVQFSNPVPRKSLEQVDEIVKVTDNGKNRFILICQPGFNPGEALFNIAVAHKVKVEELTKVRRHIEEIFKQLTNK